MKATAKDLYEKDPATGMVGHDLYIYPLLDGIGARVLEYGCGAGSLLLHLAREDRFTHLTRADTSRASLDRVEAATAGMSNPQEPDLVSVLLVENAQLPPVAHSSVDIVLSLATIKHVLDPSFPLDDFYRVAKHAATLIVDVPNYGCIEHAATRIIRRPPITGGDGPMQNGRDAGWEVWHLHTFLEQSLSFLLNDCGSEADRWTAHVPKLSEFGVGSLRRCFPAICSGALRVVGTNR